MLWRVCKGYTILSYAEVEEYLENPDTVGSLETLSSLRPSGIHQQPETSTHQHVLGSNNNHHKKPWSQFDSI